MHSRTPLFFQENIMKTSRLSFSALAILAVLALPARAHGPHEHGIARMNVGIEGNRVTIDLESPLANFLSFEHAPENDAQRQEMRNMAVALRKAENFFLFPGKAACSQESADLKSEAIPADLFAPDGARPAATPSPAEGAEGEGEEEHADLDAAFSFRCARPEELRSLDVRLFASFPNLRKVEVQLVTPRGQKAAELTPYSTSLAW
jgi:hypothetical protein